MKTKLILGDCIEVMKKMDADSIDLTVTSPPYDNLRTYNESLNWNEEIWKQVLQGLYRVTKIGGVVVWVVGDATIKGSETGTSFKQALYAKEIGFNLHDTMIFEKHNFSNPSSNRYHQLFEYMFVLSKGKPKTFNPIKDKENAYAGTTTYGKNMVIQVDGLKKQRAKKVYSEFGMNSNIFRYLTTGSIPSQRNINHPAKFPEKLAHDHIISWSNPGDVVLDCFAGSGTTGIMAYETGRNCILIEISKTYCDIIKERFKKRFNKEIQICL